MFGGQRLKLLNPNLENRPKNGIKLLQKIGRKYLSDNYLFTAMTFERYEQIHKSTCKNKNAYIYAYTGSDLVKGMPRLGELYDGTTTLDPIENYLKNNEVVLFIVWKADCFEDCYPDIEKYTIKPNLTYGDAKQKLIIVSYE